MIYQLREIPSGEAGTDQTVGEIIRLVKFDLGSLAVRNRARSILSGSVDGARADKARALFLWIARNIRFVPDPVDVETVQSPVVTLERRAGDCDDHSGLFAALALVSGLSVRLVVVGDSVDRFSHIFPEVKVGSQWVAADTTQPETGFGWVPVGFKAKKVYSIQGGAPMPNQKVAIPVDVIGKAVRGHVLNRLRSLKNRGPLSADQVRTWATQILGGSGRIESATARTAAAAALNEFAAGLPNGGGLGSLGSFADIVDSVSGGLSDAYKWAQGAGTDIYNAGATVFGGSERSPDAPLFKLPDINVTATPTDQQVRTGVADALSSPTVLVGLGLLAFVALKAWRR